MNDEITRRDLVELLRSCYDAGAAIRDIVDALSVLCMSRAAQEEDSDEPEDSAAYETMQHALARAYEDTAHLNV